MKRTYGNKRLPDTATRLVLESLVPYSDANLKLAFSPSVFFKDLENIPKQNKKAKMIKAQKVYSYSTIKNAYYRAKQYGYITTDKTGTPQLTTKGKESIMPYQPKYLGGKAYVLVAFDIPENQRSKRRELRLLLEN